MILYDYLPSQNAYKVRLLLNQLQLPYETRLISTIADISAFAYVHRADEAGLPLSDFSNVLAWIDRVRAQPRFLAVTYPYSIDPNSGNEL